MARVEIPLTTVPFQGGASLLTATATVATDDTNDHFFVNDGNTLVIAFNKVLGTAVAMTIVSVDDPFGRQEDLTLTVVVNDQGVGGPFIPAIWNQGGGNQINVDVDTADADTRLAAIKFSPIK